MKKVKLALHNMLTARGFERTMVSRDMDTWKRDAIMVIRDNRNKIVCLYLNDPKYTSSDTVYLMPDDNAKIVAFITKELSLCRK